MYLYKQNPKPNLRMFLDIYFFKNKIKSLTFSKQKGLTVREGGTAKSKVGL
jgi:hypothetical protein